MSWTTARRIAWFAGLCAAVAYYPRYSHEYSGVAVYASAAGCLLHGELSLNCGGYTFAYPPFFALVSVPFSLMPIWLHAAAWYLVLIVAIFMCVRLCENLARRTFPGDWSEPDLATFRVLTVVLSSKFILANFENQAFDAVAAVFVMLGLLAIMEKRPAWAGASFAAAAALKVTPLIFLPYLIWKGRFAGAAVFALVYVLLALLPDIVFPAAGGWHAATWMHDIMLRPFTSTPPGNGSFWITDSSMNQTFRAAIMRIFTGADHEQPQAAVDAIWVTWSFRTTVYAVSGLFILIVTAILSGSRRTQNSVAVDGAILVVSALLLTPVSSQSHFVTLILPYGMLAAAIVRRPGDRIFNAAIAIASFALTTATSNDLVGRTFTGWALWHSLPVLGTLILLVPLGRIIWFASRTRSDHRERAPA